MTQGRGGANENCLSNSERLKAILRKKHMTCSICSQEMNRSNEMNIVKRQMLTWCKEKLGKWTGLSQEVPSPLKVFQLSLNNYLLGWWRKSSCAGMN